MDLTCSEKVIQQILSEMNFNKTYNEEGIELIQNVREYIPYDMLKEFDRIVGLIDLKYGDKCKDIYTKGFKQGVKFIIETLK